MATVTPPPPPGVTDSSLATALLFDALQQAQPLTGALAEQRHYLDADPDTCVPLPGIPHPNTAEVPR